MTRRLITLSLALWLGTAGANLDQHPGAAEFADRVAEAHDLPADWVREVLAGAERKQAILDAISRPVEAKPWFDYRPIFITEARVKNGVLFWNEHADTLQRASEAYGVPPEIIVSIIGVETNYGRITGKWRVVDALATLGFHYPPRSKFFLGELEKLFLLANEEQLNIGELKGSYAGAMGFGQFIPTSYRAYAVDFSGDGVRDLWSPVDAIGSVANYFARHHWRSGEPVVARAATDDAPRKLDSPGIKPVYPVSQMREWGYRSDDLPASENDRLATLIELESESGPEFWLGFHNFYVISRYNRSALYSMAVWQLSRQILAVHELTLSGDAK